MLARMVLISWPHDPPASASQSAGITGVSHHTRPHVWFSFLLLWVWFVLVSLVPWGVTLDCPFVLFQTFQCRHLMVWTFLLALPLLYPRGFDGLCHYYSGQRIFKFSPWFHCWPKNHSGAGYLISMYLHRFEGFFWSWFSLLFHYGLREYLI